MASSHPTATDEGASLRPGLAEVALIVLLVAVLGVALAPNLLVTAYEDPLQEASSEALRGYLQDEELGVSLRVRALEELARREGETEAVLAALRVVHSASVAESEAGAALLAWVAERPSPAAAGAVLEAWEQGRLSDSFWRERFLPAGWAEAAAWTAVPLLWQSEPGEPRLKWVVDVLGHAGEQEIAVPQPREGEPGMRYATPAETLLTFAETYVDTTPPRQMHPHFEQRLFENLARTPRYLAAEAQGLARRLVASERLPHSETAQEASREAYAQAVLALAQASMPEAEYHAWLAEIAADEAHAYAPYAAAGER